ncbi:MAG: bifunctional demethylmenaquinone methyltransferase/2-methoxy-6-polyprenyl-1,4-benzoquinol methylase UbiE [Kiritimatiellia bacterium]|jgi:demethylmenaquinone methyltransferase/2-methoxy-6-polyprenyl-1,4-benzoquinol methylase|nr:bifunctional demethylmenaquinone methyltransferase/2-methoxy-6-polyprenyl-1,4-benzoquinol methylase UbiE [Kiritimatiellia bacterium]
MKVEQITPYGSGEGKREQITRAFDAIAPGYDRLNRLLSFGLDLFWRRRALRLLRGAPPARVLDVATGTADFAIAAARRLPQARVTGIDLSEAMLTLGREKVRRAGLSARVSLHRGDTLALDFPDASFDAVTAAFGVRNFASLVDGFREMRRVLKPGGRVLLLELSRPERFPLRMLHDAYLRVAVPVIGRRVSGHAREYAYLPASIRQVPQGGAMLDLLRAAGFRETRCERYTGGICSAYCGVR